MTDAVELTKALRGRWHGSYGTARCPAHDDFSPSLSISVGADSKTLVKCHAGCPQARVIDALRELGLWNGAGANSAHVETARNPRDFAPKPNHTNGERALRI